MKNQPPTTQENIQMLAELLSRLMVDTKLGDSTTLSLQLHLPTSELEIDLEISQRADPENLKNRILDITFRKRPHLTLLH